MSGMDPLWVLMCGREVGMPTGACLPISRAHPIILPVSNTPCRCRPKLGLPSLCTGINRQARGTAVKHWPFSDSTCLTAHLATCNTRPLTPLYACAPCRPPNRPPPPPPGRLGQPDTVVHSTEYRSLLLDRSPIMRQHHHPLPYQQQREGQQQHYTPPAAGGLAAAAFAFPLPTGTYALSAASLGAAAASPRFDALLSRLVYGSTPAAPLWYGSGTYGSADGAVHVPYSPVRKGRGAGQMQESAGPASLVAPGPELLDVFARVDKADRSAAAAAAAAAAAGAAARAGGRKAARSTDSGAAAAAADHGGGVEVLGGEKEGGQQLEEEGHVELSMQGLELQQQQDVDFGMEVDARFGAVPTGGGAGPELEPHGQGPVGHEGEGDEEGDELAGVVLPETNEREDSVGAFGSGGYGAGARARSMSRSLSGGSGKGPLNEDDDLGDLHIKDRQQQQEEEQGLVGVRGKVQGVSEAVRGGGAGQGLRALRGAVVRGAGGGRAAAAAAARELLSGLRQMFGGGAGGGGSGHGGAVGEQNGGREAVSVDEVLEGLVGGGVGRQVGSSGKSAGGVGVGVGKAEGQGVRPGCSRLVASRVFSELLVLHSRGYVRLSQEREGGVRGGVQGQGKGEEEGEEGGETGVEREPKRRRRERGDGEEGEAEGGRRGRGVAGELGPVMVHPTAKLLAAMV